MALVYDGEVVSMTELGEVADETGIHCQISVTDWDSCLTVFADGDKCRIVNKKRIGRLGVTEVMVSVHEDDLIQRMAFVFFERYVDELYLCIPPIEEDEVSDVIIAIIYTEFFDA